MASKPAHTEKPELRMVLVGRTGVGKSLSGNTILGRKDFESGPSSSSITSECQKKIGEFDGQLLAVVDTPGLYDSGKDEQTVKREIIRCYFLAAPGPHVFLVVIQVGRFAKEDQEALKVLQMMFGEKAARYTMILFTYGDNLEADAIVIEQFIGKNPTLCDFVCRYHGGYHVFNNRKKDPSQVKELLEKINKMVQRNGGGHYTSEALEEAEKAIKARMEKIQRENPALTPKEARQQAEEYNWFNVVSAVAPKVLSVAAVVVIVLQ